MSEKQRLLIIEGADKNWKTTISRKLQATFGLPYFKHGGESQAHLTGGGKGSYFKNLLDWSQPFFVDFLDQTGVSALFDRTYPSEFVYSQVFNREFNLEVFKNIDLQWARLGAVIVVLHRSDLSGLDDRDEFSHIEENMGKINALYKEFAEGRHTQCKLLSYDVSEYEDSEVLTLRIIADLMRMGF